MLLILTHTVWVVLADLQLGRAVLAHSALLEPTADGMFAVIVDLNHVLVFFGLVLFSADVWRTMHVEV